MDESPGLPILDEGPPGDLDDQIGPVLAEAALGAALFSVGGHIFPLVAEVQQGGHVVVHHKDDVAALAAVAPVGPAGRHIFFPVEADVSIAPAPGLDPDFRNIYKHDEPFLIVPMRFSDRV